MSFDLLVQDIADQLNRTDMSEDLRSHFLYLGQQKIVRDLRCAEMEVLVDGVTIDANSHVPLPADYLEASRFWLDSTGKKIDMIPMQRIRSIQINTNGVPPDSSWGPLYVARDMQNFYFFPRVGSEISYVYYARPNFLGPAFQTNSITTIAYDALLFAAVSEGFDYLKEYDVASHWLQKAIAVVNQLNDERKRQDKGGSTQVMGSPYAV